MIAWLALGCGDRVALHPDLPVSFSRIETALFAESAFSAPPDDGYGLLVLSSGGLSCESVFEVDTYGLQWLGQEGSFTAQQAGLVVELRWLELGWEGPYPVGGELSTDEGLRSAALYAYEEGQLYALNTDSGVVEVTDHRDGGVSGRIRSAQVHADFTAEHCGQAPNQGYY